MISGLISGLIGGVISTLIFVVIAQKARRKITDGKLQYGLFMPVMGWLCAIFAVVAFSAYFYDKDVFKKASEFWAITGLFLFFAVSAFACFAEYYKVYGEFDFHRIKFHTPWTGSKHELWDDLISVEYVDSMSWYTLKFESGTIIRMSKYLQGNSEVLEILQARGFDIE